MPEIVYTESFFKSAAKLQKRYKHIQEDTETLADQLEKGELLGDRVQGVAHRVYKVRIKNSDARRGKRGGYRVIYYLETDDKIVMIIIYSKSDQTDIPSGTIRQLIAEYETQNPPNKS